MPLLSYLLRKLSSIFRVVSVLSLVIVIVHLFTALVTLPNTPTADPLQSYKNHLPVATDRTYYGGLYDLVAHTTIRMGTMVDDNLITSPLWSVEADLVVNEFNSITPVYGFFGTIHPCPPQAIVDSRTTTYNQKIHDAAKNYWICHPYLNYTNPSTVDWATYNTTVKYDWDDYDNAVLWARENEMEVHFQTFLWDLADSPTVMPRWVDVDHLGITDTSPSSVTQPIARALLYIMEDHIEEVVKHYCANSNSNLNGVVYAFDVVNEVTEGDGTIRTWNSPTTFSRALINEIQEEADPNYTGSSEAYYIYKAFQLSRAAVNAHCQSPHPKLIYNDKFPVDILWTQGPNPWAEGAFDLLDEFEDEYPNLIDGLGIQAHLNIQPTSQVPPDPIADLRLILEAFEGTGVEVQITELDVSIRKPNYYDHFPPNEVSQYFDDKPIFTNG